MTLCGHQAPALLRMWRKLRSARWYETKQSIGCDTGDTLPCCDDATSDKQGQRSPNIVVTMPYSIRDLYLNSFSLFTGPPMHAASQSNNCNFGIYQFWYFIVSRSETGHRSNKSRARNVDVRSGLASYWSIIKCSAISLAEHNPHKDAEFLSTCPM